MLTNLICMHTLEITNVGIPNTCTLCSLQSVIHYPYPMWDCWKWHPYLSVSAKIHGYLQISICGPVSAHLCTRQQPVYQLHIIQYGTKYWRQEGVSLCVFCLTVADAWWCLWHSSMPWLTDWWSHCHLLPMERLCSVCMSTSVMLQLM